ncbi:MAG: thymidine phosphorylase [Ignavibacteriales bacterium]|nr:thymidine phosphorylase [Ignavibacteriales bacterium]
MNPVELIRKKRDGQTLTEAEYRFLLSAYVDGHLPEYQMSAFLMACYFRGMSNEETLAFTKLMLYSGEVLDLSDIPGVKVDKHSTGGVGDKVSLLLAPIVAACGVPVPMISGRGLGHTGGTLDKLESIPGFRTDFSIDKYTKLIKEIGLVMIGQTEEIAPADKRMYALRDVTATVECIPLIAGSIMSKKLAGGADALVLDVKSGRGAFMQSDQKAIELARTLVDIGSGFGKQMLGFITDMSQPLGSAIGNWLEVVESVECLKGNRGTDDESKDLMEVTLLLSGAMVFLGKKASSVQEGIERSKEALATKKGYQKFLDLVKTQGGDVSSVDNLEKYPISEFSADVKSSDRGFVSSIDPLEMGLTSITLGAGRQKIDDIIDPKAGIVLKKKVGDPVAAGDTLAVLYTDSEEVISPARDRIGRSFKIVPDRPTLPPLIKYIVEEEGIRKWDG